LIADEFLKRRLKMAKLKICKKTKTFFNLKEFGSNLSKNNSLIEENIKNKYSIPNSMDTTFDTTNSENKITFTSSIK